MAYNVLHWLEHSAETYPEKAAFADARTSISFKELLEATLRIGSFVANRAPRRSPIAFFCDKTIDAVAGLFGAVQAGCFYCVLDVRQPAPRLREMASTLQPALVIADAQNLALAQDVFSELGLTVLALENAAGAPVDDALIEQRRRQATSTDPLYVNFTSGSTGTPKGVTVGQLSVLHFIPHFSDIFDFTSSDQIANQAPLDFDVSVKDLYTGIYTGATVHLVPREYFSVPTKLMDFLCDRNITSLTWAVGALCFVTTMGGFEYRTPSEIRKVLFSGEVMPPKHLRRWMDEFPEACFANLYGPTEITCNCTYHIVTPSNDLTQPLPAGIPFPDEDVFLLDGDDKLVTQPGEEGEICVGGVTLALGYYNAPDRTAKAFVPNPLAAFWPSTIYRTGDMGTWGSDGLLRFSGRRDNQIKHLGQRIELGEIEYATCTIPGIDRACCLYDEQKKRILLFYSGSLEKSEVKAQLKELLPSHMVPNRLTRLDALPLTKNGKVDRAALRSAI